MGVAASLNLGIRHILQSGVNCKYIFRFDSDDICFPERIQKQIDFMEINQEIDISGTSLEIFNDANPDQQYKF